MAGKNKMNLKPNNANDLILACVGAVFMGVFLGWFFFGSWIGAGVGVGAALILLFSIYRKEKKE